MKSRDFVVRFADILMTLMDATLRFETGGTLAEEKQRKMRQEKSNVRMRWISETVNNGTSGFTINRYGDEIFRSHGNANIHHIKIEPRDLIPRL
jgi:hypothetical protein